MTPDRVNPGKVQSSRPSLEGLWMQEWAAETSWNQKKDEILFWGKTAGNQKILLASIVTFSHHIMKQYWLQRKEGKGGFKWSAVWEVLREHSWALRGHIEVTRKYMLEPSGCGGAPRSCYQAHSWVEPEFYWGASCWCRGGQAHWLKPSRGVLVCLLGVRVQVRTLVGPEPYSLFFNPGPDAEPAPSTGLTAVLPLKMCLHVSKAQ